MGRGKKVHYKTKIVLISSLGTINFAPESLEDVVGVEKLSYDEFLDIQRDFGDKVRYSFEQCYYEMPAGFKGQIDRRTKNKICFKRIYVDGMYRDGSFFEGKEDYVWMELKGFEKYKDGDCVSFFARFIDI